MEVRQVMEYINSRNWGPAFHRNFNSTFMFCCANLEEYLDELKSRENLWKTVIYAFEWEHSPEGEDYWDEIHTEFRNWVFNNS